MTYQIETNNWFAQKVIGLLYRLGALQAVSVLREIDENSEAYQAFWVEMAQKETDKGEGRIVSEKEILNLFE